MKRLIGAFLLYLLVPLFSPAFAQEVRMGILNDFAQWATSAWDGRSGRAADGLGIPRAAADANKRYGQKAKVGVNSNDVDQMVSDRLWNPNGFTEVRGRIKDGQDEGSTTVEIFGRTGGLLFSRTFDYIGHRANGDTVRWKFTPVDQTVLQGARIVYTMTEHDDPKRKANKNGATIRQSVTVAAEAACQPGQRARFAGPSIDEIRSASREGKGRNGGKSGRGRGDGKRGKN